VPTLKKSQARIGFALRAQERAPAQTVAQRCRRQAGVGEHVPHERRRDVDAELAQLADDPHIAPARVLAGESYDQFAHRVIDRRPAG
jgi:hypothetical protein